MSWRHNLTITRVTGAVDQDADTGYLLADPDETTVYSGKGTLLHDFRSTTRDDAKDADVVSRGTLYLKSRKLVWSLQEGDVVHAHDLKLNIDLTARVDAIDHVIGMLKVSDIRLVAVAATSGYGNNYGNDFGGALV